MIISLKELSAHKHLHFLCRLLKLNAFAKDIYGLAIFLLMCHDCLEVYSLRSYAMNYTYIYASSFIHIVRFRSHVSYHFNVASKCFTLSLLMVACLRSLFSFATLYLLQLCYR